MASKRVLRSHTYRPASHNPPLELETAMLVIDLTLSDDESPATLQTSTKSTFQLRSPFTPEPHVPSISHGYDVALESEISDDDSADYDNSSDYADSDGCGKSTDDDSNRIPLSPSKKHRKKYDDCVWVLAPVNWYNLRQIVVRCPYCGFLEGHLLPRNVADRGFEDLAALRLAAGVSRLALCEQDVELPYILAFPGENHALSQGLGFDIRDRGHDPKIQAADPETENNMTTEVVKFWSTEQNNQMLARFLRAEASAKISHTHLEQPILDVDGNTKLAVAALDCDPNICHQYLCQGDDVNVSNHAGWTPLMHAAFLGFIEVVVMLLAFGADVSLKSHTGQTALDLSENLTMLQEARLNCPRVRNINIHSQKRQRMLISIMLGGKYRVTQKPSVEVDSPKRCATKLGDLYHTWRVDEINSGYVHFLWSELSVYVNNLQKKTQGILIRRQDYLPIYAVSGFGKSTHAKMGNLLDNKQGADDVLMVAKHLGVEFPRHARDWVEKGYEHGSLHAGHVEKKLMVAFILRHCFPRFGQEGDDDLERLERVQPSTRLTEAVILVDSDMCPVCVSFRQSLEAAYNVKFHFVQMRRTVELQGENFNAVAMTPKAGKIPKMTADIRDRTKARVAETRMASSHPLSPPSTTGEGEVNRRIMASRDSSPTLAAKRRRLNTSASGTK